MNVILNIILYQAVWFICVLGGNDMAWFALLPLGLHLYLSSTRWSDILLMATALVIGMVVDGTLRTIGLLSFSDDGAPIPLWLAMIWLSLATLPNHSLKWLKNHLLLAALGGMIGGPLAYWSGVKLGAAFFDWPPLAALATLAFTWCLLTPALMLLSTRLESLVGKNICGRCFRS